MFSNHSVRMEVFNTRELISRFMHALCVRNRGNEKLPPISHSELPSCAHLVDLLRYQNIAYICQSVRTNFRTSATAKSHAGGHALLAPCVKDSCQGGSLQSSPSQIHSDLCKWTLCDQRLSCQLSSLVSIDRSQRRITLVVLSRP